MLVVAVLAGATMVLVSQQLVGQAERNQRQLAAEQRDIRSRLSNAHEEEQEIRNRIARYQKILDSGMVNQEERLIWIEQIARIKVARKLLDVQYELSPQHPIDDGTLPGGATAGGYEFMASSMKLQVALLHEEDLLGLLADLRQSVRAQLLIRHCSIDRTPAAATGTTERGPAPQLRAECLIDWVTLREKRP